MQHQDQIKLYQPDKKRPVAIIPFNRANGSLLRRSEMVQTLAGHLHALKHTGAHLSFDTVNYPSVLSYEIAHSWGPWGDVKDAATHEQTIAAKFIRDIPVFKYAAVRKKIDSVLENNPQ